MQQGPQSPLLKVNPGLQEISSPNSIIILINVFFGRIILRYVANDNYLSDIAKALKELKYDKVAFFISDFSNGHIVCKLNQGYKDTIRGLELDAETIEQHIKSLREPQFIDTAGSSVKGLPIDFNQYFDPADYSLVFMPIVYDIAVLGFFFISPEKSIQPIKKKNINFLTGVPNQIALGIHKQQAFDEIAESDRIKTEFIATASHDLKTPIQAMMLGLDELELSRDIDLNLPPLKKVTSKLADEINNLLSLHRIESKLFINFDMNRIEKKNPINATPAPAFRPAAAKPHPALRARTKH